MSVSVDTLTDCDLFSPCPHPRYGQTQILLDNNHLVIIGGCGGPSVMLNDVWMLEFDMDFQRGWKWTQLKVLKAVHMPLAQ